MKDGTKTLLRASALVGALAAGAVLQHARLGIELIFISLGVLYAGLLHRHWAAFRERAPSVSGAVFALELGAFAGLVRSQDYPIARWSAPLAALAALATATPPIRVEADAPRAPWLDELWTAALALGALGGSAWLAHASTAVPLVLAIVFALEAWGPRAPRTTASATRRSAAFALIGAIALLHEHQGVDAASAEGALIGAAAIAGAATLLELALRLRPRPSADEERLRRRRALFRLIAASLVLAFTWLGGEAVFRIVPSLGGDRTLGSSADSTWHVPGGKYVYYGAILGQRETSIGAAGNELRWNHLTPDCGFHDVEHELAKPKHRVRVAVIGDSYVDAIQLPLEKIYPRLLEARLAKATPPPVEVEAIAIGYSGWGQPSELDALDRYALPYRPDVVVLEFLPANDVRNNLPELERFANDLDRTAARRAQVFAIDKGLRFTAFVAEKVHFTLKRVLGIPSEIDSDAFRPKPIYTDPALWDQAWKRTDELIGAIHEKTRGSGARLVVAIFPGQMEVNAIADPAWLPRDMDGALPARRMLEICKRRGIPCLDLAPRFAAHGQPEAAHVTLEYDGHWGEIGHRWGAEETARFLVDETSLWREVVSEAQR